MRYLRTKYVFDLLEDDYDDIAMEKRTMKFQGETPRFP